MKLSISLLQEEFGEKIFKKSLDKAKDLLAEIFDLDFNNSDPKILRIIDKSKEYKYEILLDIKGRRITALFNFEVIQDGILSEVLRLRETAINNILISVKEDNYNEITKKAMDYLEEKYDIDFTPLDPEEENKNIIKVHYIEDKAWVAKFISDNHEAEFKAEYNFNPGESPYLTITQFNEHIIYF